MFFSLLHLLHKSANLFWPTFHNARNTPDCFAVSHLSNGPDHCSELPSLPEHQGDCTKDQMLLLQRYTANSQHTNGNIYRYALTVSDNGNS